jgi:hypothetical protein
LKFITLYGGPFIDEYWFIVKISDEIISLFNWKWFSRYVVIVGVKKRSLCQWAQFKGDCYKSIANHQHVIEELRQNLR